jgi:hypothetical protein
MENNLTPVDEMITPVKTMDFYEAIKQIMKGKYVCRISWNNADYCLLKDGYLSIFTKGDFHSWLINDGDIEGQDWVIYNES